MITPIDKAPPKFMERYQRIMDGKEKIETIAQLKDFWLFAVAQGQEHREMREYIASMSITVPVSRYVRTIIYSDAQLRYAYDKWEVFNAIGESPDPTRSVAAYSDNLWDIIRFEVSSVAEKQLDAKIKQYQKSRLSPEQAALLQAQIGKLFKNKRSAKM